MLNKVLIKLNIDLFASKYITVIDREVYLEWKKDINNISGFY